VGFELVEGACVVRVWVGGGPVAAVGLGQGFWAERAAGGLALTGRGVMPPLRCWTRSVGPVDTKLVYSNPSTDPITQEVCISHTSWSDDGVV